MNSIPRFEAQLESGLALERYEAALALASIYRDSIFNLNQEYQYIQLAIGSASKNEENDKELARAHLSLGSNYLVSYSLAKMYYAQTEDTLRLLLIEEYEAGESCQKIISNSELSSTARYQAGGSVVLNESFEVIKGAIFEAETRTCIQ